ncbi:hypothetical protein [Acinetobacter shaoyimingii]|uniref:Uncharacterized protein n=1 Tax=Acinetobacter shaoyimingii TaxID=2715164 RepID=A0A6G8RYG9_9GAMM|nr:hypothetical protein [Acinetobacter shaoyimingii]QIO06996.1 hypothetical protein G8E00_14170 [Acinetobacter shaoyimingii]
MHQNNNPHIHLLDQNKYSEIEINHDEIVFYFNQLDLYIKNTAEFQHIKMALLQHIKEARKYLNKSIKLLQKEYSEINLLNLDMKVFNQHEKKQRINNIEEMENQIRKLISTIDERVFLIKTFSFSDTKAHARLLASAMIELMEIQHLYIYPYREDLIPDFLKNIDFKEKIKLKK